MIKAHFSISIDTEGNRHVSLPLIPVKLPDWKEVATINPYVEITIADIHEVLNAHKENNTKRVNELLSKYY